jgi:heat shock protein HslJ
MVLEPWDGDDKRMHRNRSKPTWTLIVAALLGGCGSYPAEEPPAAAPDPAAPAAPAPTFSTDVLGATWEWIGVMSTSSQTEVDEPARYTVQFDKDGFAFVQADCNRGQANYFLPAAGQIAIHGISLTKVACPSGSMGTRFVSQLELVRTYALADGNLVLEMPGETGSLVFRRRGSR